jgi:Fic family protein
LNRSAFTDDAPGELWAITVRDDKDWAFIPASLPNRWQVPDPLWPLLVEAREALARLDGVGRFMPNYNLLLRPLQRREALRSSSLEGTYATPQQLLLFEIEPREPKSAHDPVNAWREVLNYSTALEAAIQALESRPISLNLIRDMHRTLLSGVRGAQRDPGNFRRSQVHIGSDRRFIPPPPHQVMPCLDWLEKFIHQEHEIDPLIFCFMVHYQFETIHPFLDGNGRVGRLLLSLMIYQNCKLNKPWIYLSSFFDKYKDEYIEGLYRVSTRNDWFNWITFCLRGTIEQSKDALYRFEQLLTLRSQYMESLSQAGGNVRLNKLIDHLFESPAISVPQVASICNVHYNTARSDVDRLVNAQIVVESDILERPRIYFAPRILEIAYGD